MKFTKLKAFFSFRQNKFFWINLAAMILTVIVLIFISLKGLDIYTRHGQAIVVPDAKGMSAEEAKALFARHELKCIIADSIYVKDKTPGIVTEHSPQAGQKVKKERVIYLTTNTKHIPTILVPDVADNSSLRQAMARIQSAGFTLGTNETIGGEKDWVYGVKYNGRRLNAGEKVPMGATLSLIVGNGLAGEMFGQDSIPYYEDIEDSLNQPTVEDSWF